MQFQQLLYWNILIIYVSINKNTFNLEIIGMAQCLKHQYDITRALSPINKTILFRARMIANRTP